MISQSFIRLAFENLLSEMTIQDYISKGGTLVLDPVEMSTSADEILANYGNIVDSICIVAKSEAGSAYYPSSTAPKDPRFGELFTAFAQIANDIGIRVYALIHGNMDGFFSRDPNFQMHRSGGIALEGYVCPTQEVYWQYLAEIAVEVASKSQIEGIILKDLMYPRDVACFCENCRRTFALEVNIDRDFSLEQLKKKPAIYSKWQTNRVNALRGMISTIINRVHSEKKVEIITELVLDPETLYFDGATNHFAQDIRMISQITPHVLLHLHPWSSFPTNDDEMNVLMDALAPIRERMEGMRNSIFLWQPDTTTFNYAQSLQNQLSSSHIFFTDYQPVSFLNRRTLHLNLGV